MRRSHRLAFVTTLASIFFGFDSFAFTGGNFLTSGKTAGSTCANPGCHTPGAPVPDVTITGPAELAAGGQADYTLEITTALPNGSCGIAASDGVTLTPGAELKADKNELTHKAPIPATGGKASFKFTVKAPESGTKFTLFAAGLGSAGNGQAGDGMKAITLDVTVTGGKPAGSSTSSSSGAASGDDDDPPAAGDDRFSEDPFTDADAKATCAVTPGATSDHVTAAFFALAAVAVAFRGSRRRRD